MVLVVSSLGKIKGRVTRSKEGKVIYAFKGLPYAQPPLGVLRFARPQPIKPWRKTLDVSGKKGSSECLQVNVVNPESKFLLGQEDCLYLNVFTPHLPGGGNDIKLNLPVIVWIHGGAFCVGSNDSKIYGPDYFLEYGIVLVTINYRFEYLSIFIDRQRGWRGAVQ